jgi:hypothetical protein
MDELLSALQHKFPDYFEKKVWKISTGFVICSVYFQLSFLWKLKNNVTEGRQNPWSETSWIPNGHILAVRKGEKYSVISEMVVRILLPFSTRHLYELGVWTLTQIIIPPKKGSPRNHWWTNYINYKFSTFLTKEVPMSHWHSKKRNGISGWLMRIIIWMRVVHNTYAFKFVVEI